MRRSEVPERQCPSCYAVRAVWITGCMNSIHFVSTKEWARALVHRMHNFPSPDDDVVLVTALREAEARGLDDAALREQLAQVTEDLRKCRDEIGEYR